MKTIIVCEQGFNEDKRLIDSVVVWEGELSSVPRVGDLIEVFEGWGAATVKRVFWQPRENTIEINIPADTDGEYAAELEVRKARKVEGTRKPNECPCVTDPSIYCATFNKMNRLIGKVEELKTEIKGKE